jgi:DNA helicase-2/ATP-dependent DNA helicase PcrA
MVAAAPPKSPFEDLNPAQRAAATYGQSGPDGVEAGPLLIIAGAGTGKTLTLAHRVAHLVLAGTAPERLLLLTFSRRAAREMTARARRIVTRARAARSGRPEGDIRLPWAGTFHAVANRILREFAPNLGLTPGFSVLDRGDAADLMDVVRHRLDYSAGRRRFPRKDTCLAIYSRTVNSRRELGAVLEAAWPWCLDWEGELRNLFRAYADAKLESAALDYDDLLLYWCHLMSEPALAAAVASRFDQVLVDEYQDTNVLQAEIVRRLSPDGHGVTVVGDDAQSIYSFRAAEVENILGFAAGYRPPARVVTLEQNYRSVQPVLDAANAVIARGRRQYRKRLHSRRRSAQRPRYVTVPDDAAQADYVVGQVLAAREAGQRLMDQAVLFRSSHHSDRLELELTRREIPFVKYGGLKFLEATHVKDFLSLLRWAENPRDQIAAFRVAQLLPGIGPAAAQRAFEHLAAGDFALTALASFRPPAPAAADWAGLARLMAALAPGRDDWQTQLAEVRRWYQPQLERAFDNWQVRAADLDALEQIAAAYPSRERFLTELTLDPPQASGDFAGPPLLDEDFLVLSTVHSAKGQEWHSVYLLNVADGNFPSEFSTGDPALVEEERRLLYVAMTRARDHLHLIAPLKYYTPHQRTGGDGHVYGARSRFLPDAVLEKFERAHHAPAVGEDGAPGRPATVLDVASRVRDMW